MNTRMSLRSVGIFFAVILSGVSVLGMSYTFANAEVPSGALIIRPAKIELTLSPGQSKTVLVTLENGTPLPLLVDLSFEDVAAREQSSSLDDPIRLLGKETGTYSLKEMLTASEHSFDMLSGKTTQVPVIITVPKDALPGGRYGSAVFSFAPNQKSPANPANVAVKSRIAAMIYLRIEGNVKEEGSIVAFGLFNNAKYIPSHARDPLRFQVSYENKGDVYLDPYGRLTVKDILGKEHAVTVDPWAVLPGATRMREIDVLDPLLPGYYTARLELNRGYKDIIDTREVSFFILPTLTQTLIGLLALIILALLLRRSLALSKNSI